MSQQDPSGYPSQPYGAPYGEQPPPGYGYGYGYPPPPRSQGPSANAIVSLVLNLLAVVSCCNIFGIPGAILAGMAISRASREPERARTMVIWSWVLLGLGFALGVALFLFLGLSGYLND
ncbi:DUF4190 domain-containing protein [Nonomuraea sp. 10N515B]|uniref:DUF4190 domain-containing protein n=1 Tax=Nonomuraea sp. 10N515B TaxID=3457422 RepID=UPI003FCC64B6